MCCDCMVFVFFFFKQKTAYEMRISDWSSDVCSSDLEQFRRRGLFLEARNVAKPVEDVQRLCDQHLLDAGEVHVDDRLHRLPVGHLDVAEKEAPQKAIGSASGRRKAGLTVWRSVVAATLNKKSTYNDQTINNKINK